MRTSDNGNSRKFASRRDPYVGEVGCDIFVGDEWAPNEQKIATLDDLLHPKTTRSSL